MIVCVCLQTACTHQPHLGIFTAVLMKIEKLFDGLMCVNVCS